jgi:hypothetical protein
MRRRAVVVMAVALILIMAQGMMAQVDTAWTRAFPGGIGNTVCVDDVGNVYVGGYGQIPSSGQPGSIITAYDSSGQTLWTRYAEQLERVFSFSHTMEINRFGDLYLSESLDLGGLWNFCTLKYLTNGDSIWMRTYHNDYDCQVKTLTTDAQGNVYVVGRGNGWITVKYDRDGNEIWARTYTPQPGYSTADPYDILADDSGNVIIGGTTRTVAWPADGITVVKYDSLGNLLWDTRCDSVSFNVYVYEEAQMAVDHAGNIYVTGRKVPGYNDISRLDLIKFLPNGDTAWTRAYGAPGQRIYAYGYLTAVDSLGFIYAVGYAVSEFYTIKFTPDGDTCWSRSYNGAGDDADIPCDVVVGASGAVYVGGRSSGFVSESPYCVVKYTSDGDLAWVARCQRVDSVLNEMLDITLDRWENVYTTGAITAKFVQTSTSTDDGNPSLPENDLLLAAYPNPFNARTTIQYELTGPSGVNLTILDLLGNKVEMLVDEHQEAGRHQVIWNADGVSSGIYFYRLKAGRYSSTKRILLIK